MSILLQFQQIHNNTLTTNGL